MKAKLYLESTVPSYYLARPSRDLILAAQQQLTRDWWATRLKDFNVFVSEVVLDEISAGEAAMAQKRIVLLRPFGLLATPTRSLRWLTH
jgi:hypothetical protein